MDFRIQIASIVVGSLIWTIVAIALKRARLYPSYATLWVGIGTLLILLPLYANSLRWIATNLFGIVGANHLIYAMLFSFLMIYLFYLTQKVCELINRVERLNCVCCHARHSAKHKFALSSRGIRKLSTDLRHNSMCHRPALRASL